MKKLASDLMQTLHEWHVPILAIAALFGIAMCCSSSYAQSGAGSIQGNVSDSTGAVIPGASIQAIQLGTSATFNTKSNSAGFYQVPDLFTGTYDVKISAPGFKTYETSIELQVAQNAVINPVMTLGAVTQQVVVQGNAVQLIDTNTDTISATLGNQEINQLPMNGRFLASLTGMTTPGLEGGSRANGTMDQAMEYVADGVPLDEKYFGWLTGGSLPDPDSVQEVRVETSDSSAQYDSPASGIITTKAGTKSLHGTFFETARNNAWGIAKGRSDPSNLVAPEYIRNEWGASAGGPIIIPHVYLGKGKSFWFFAWERYSLANNVNQLTTAPTAAMRAGDFSGLVNGSGVLQQLYDPATTAPSANCNGSGQTNQYCRAPFGGKPDGSTTTNYIPINRLSPTAKIIYDMYPLPTSTANPLLQPNLNIPEDDNTFTPTATFRLDHNFNDNNRAYLRYTDVLQSGYYGGENGGNNPASLAADGFPAGAFGIQFSPATTFAAALGFTHVFSPSFFSETILGQQWFQTGSYGYLDNTDWEAKLGLPNNFGQLGFPGLQGMSFPENGTQGVYGGNQILSTIDENLTKTKGKNQMQFGGRFYHERFATLPDTSADNFPFDNGETGLENPDSGANYAVTPNTGYADADFFLGAAATYVAHVNPPRAHLHDMEINAYFQDNYHVTKNLSINIGMRYAALPAPWIKDGLMNSLDYKTGAEVLAVPFSTLIAEGYATQALYTNLTNIGIKFETPAEAGMPSALLNSYDLNFSPRLGLAYQLFGGKHGTVIRGGYGRYVCPVPIRSGVKNLMQQLPLNETYYQSYTGANTSPDGLPDYEVRAPQPVVMGVNSANVVNSNSINAVTPGTGQYWDFSADWAPDFITETNFTIEQAMKGNSALRLSWVWTHGTNLELPYYPNYWPSSFTWEMQTGTVPPQGGASVIGTPLQDTYSSTALGPWNNTVWGTSVLQQKNGWSNDNALQVNYQRPFHHGIAYQIMYVWSKPIRSGGNASNDGWVATDASFLGALGTVGTMTSPYGKVGPYLLPPPPPAGVPSWADYKALVKFQQNLVDVTQPLHHIQFNAIVDLPFGTGKRFLGNAHRALNEVVGGFQLAGDGSIVTQDFQPDTSSFWGLTNPIHVYKHKVPITDCRSGVCYKEFLWYNGYIAPDAYQNCTSNCVSGLPSDYAPYDSPIDNTPGTANYGTNLVAINLANGTQITDTFNPGVLGSNIYTHTVLNGPINYGADLSLFKVFPITETMDLRFNMDAFNFLNVQGYNNPNPTDGTEAVQPGVGVAYSHNSPRQVQFTLRLTF